MHKEKVCFVVIGFGIKTNPSNGRQIDLDKTYFNLIKPVFKDLGIECFRAREVVLTGVIDVPMYEWIYKADIVVADISTLNPNAIYELGVRHALRPHTTIVISEKELAYPFDVSHTMIDSYEHLGSDIGVTEAKRFKKLLKDKVKKILKSKKTDSPVYTFLPNLKPPTFKKDEIEKLKATSEDQRPTISELINNGEQLKNKGDYKVAKLLFEAALSYDKNNSSLIQKIALVTYKAQLPNAKKALLAAQSILVQLRPDETTDIETLGLSGAINKRLFELTSDAKYLKKSIKFYEKGFILNNDYYNGVNAAYMYLVMASIATDKMKRISSFVRAQDIYNKVITLCLELIRAKRFSQRGDILWVYQTLSKAYLGIEKKTESERMTRIAEKLSKGKFDKETFDSHNLKVTALLKLIKNDLRKNK